MCVCVCVRMCKLYTLHNKQKLGVQRLLLNQQKQQKKCKDLLPGQNSWMHPPCHPSTPSSMVTAGNQGDWSFIYPPPRSIALRSGM